MAIEITEFADVSISVSPVGVTAGDFGTLGFLTNESDIANAPISPAERSRAYTSLASVSADWPAGTEVYKAATAFYGQTPTPRDFVVLMAFSTDQAASLVGGGAEDLEALKTISDGDLTLTIDGTEVAVSALNFSSATTLPEIAAILETAVDAVLTGATVTHSGYQFVVNGVLTGATGSITAATGSSSEALGLQAHQAVASAGVAAESPVDALAANLASGSEWVATVTHKQYRDVLAGAEGHNTLEIAAWCEAAKKLFMNTSNDLSTLSSANSSDIASVLKAASFRFSLTTFSKNPAQYPSASVFGRAASVNFATVGSTITLNLKQMPGISAENLTPSEFAVLRSKYASAVVLIGKSTNAYTDSRMASGSWLDTTHGLMWLEARCEADMFNLLYTTNTKIPYTQTGINMCVSALEASLEAAVRNGLAAPGFLPDGTFLPKGYKVTAVSLADTAAGDVSNRLYAGLSFVMSGAGALQDVEVTGSFSE
tara:strand:+ start:632 stop:2089 length:1458 start_codon:yes stop_codon:yes gene_type:complete